MNITTARDELQGDWGARGWPGDCMVTTGTAIRASTESALHWNRRLFDQRQREYPAAASGTYRQIQGGIEQGASTGNVHRKLDERKNGLCQREIAPAAGG